MKTTLLVLLALLLLSACSDPITDQARAAVGVSVAMSAGGDALTEARRASIARAEAEHPVDPEHDIAVREVIEAYRPVGVAYDGARTALLTWIDALELAQMAGGDAGGLEMAFSAAQRLLRAYQDVQRIAETLQIDLPELPEALINLLGGPQ